MGKNRKEQVDLLRRKIAFEININFMNFFDTGWSSPFFVRHAKQFLMEKEQVMTMEGLMKHVLGKDKERFKDVPIDKVIEFIEETFPRSFYINTDEDLVIDLNRNISVLREDLDSFIAFFFFRLSRKPIHHISAYLNHHLVASFGSNLKDMAEFLEDGMNLYTEDLGISDLQIHGIRRWLTRKETETTTRLKHNAKSGISSRGPVTLPEDEQEMEATLEPYDNLLTVQQASKFLSIPVSAIYKRSAKGSIPHKKIGHLIRFSKAELVEWINSKPRSNQQNRRKKLENFLSRERNKRL